jgi:hypothetical protein
MSPLLLSDGLDVEDVFVEAVVERDLFTEEVLSHEACEKISYHSS